MDEIVDHPLRTYFETLESSRPNETSELFAEDAVYFRPVTFDGDMRMEVTRGRAAILALLERRGKQPDHHEVRACVSEGRNCMIEGIVRESSLGRNEVVFMSRATFDEDGLIARYHSVAFPSVPGVIDSAYEVAADEASPA